MADDDRWAVEMPIVKRVTEGQSLDIADVALWAASRLEFDGGITPQQQKNTAEKLRASLENQADTIATLRADLAKAVEGLEGALGGLGCRSDCEWLHPDGSKCDCGNRERKLIAQSLIKELRP